MTKSFIIAFSILTFLSFNVQAQSGPGIVFEYDAAGNRILREFRNPTPYKPGKEQPVDTLNDKIKLNDIESEIVNLRAYPNPVKDYFVVENLSLKESQSVQIDVYDNNGKLLERIKTTSSVNRIQFNQYSSGIYYVHYILNAAAVRTWKVSRL